MNQRLGLRALSWAHLFLGSSLAAQASPPQTPDSTFLLESNDPARRPSPFIGNGHLGMVVPALGLGPAPSYMTALFEEAPRDVPRIVVIPAWGALGLYNGSRWLAADSSPAAEVKDYRQTVDMHSGTALTSYNWGSGSRRVTVRTQTFVSRAAPSLAVARLDLTPGYTGRVGVRFALTGWPPPRRLALGTLRRADPSWSPNDIWYPGHMIIRSRQVTRTGNGARLTMASLPEGRPSLLAQALELSWPRALENPTVHTTASGDTALVELSFDGAEGRTYSFIQVASAMASATESHLVTRAGNEARAGLERGFRALADANAEAWSHRWETDIQIEGDPGAAAGRSVDAVLSALQRRLRHRDGHPADGSVQRGATTATSSGTPTPGCSRRSCSPIPTSPTRWWRSGAAPWPRPRPTPGQQLPRGDVPLGGRRAGPGDHSALRRTERPLRDPRHRRRRPGPVAVLSRHRGFGLAGARGRSRSSGRRPTSGSAARHCDSTRPLPHRNVVSVSEGLIGVTDDAYTNAVARKNLEMAGAASRRLGKRPTRAGTQVAAKLHMPYDSASEFYRTYEGAPDSTLGRRDAAAGLSARRAMSERAKRAQLEQAVRALLAEGPGAMMGSTLLSVDAAELGDRALVDSLLPHQLSRASRRGRS